MLDLKIKMLAAANRIRSIPSKIEEVWSVKSLPEDLRREGRENVCNILDKMETMRLNRVKAADEKLRNEFQSLSLKCAEEYKRLAHNLESELTYIEDKFRNEPDMTEEVAEKLRSEWNEAVDDWRTYVWRTDNVLSAECTRVLAEHRKLLRASKYFTDERVTTTLRNIVTELNHIIINNEQIYTDTELHLKLLGETTINEWKYLREQQDILKRNQIQEEEPQEKPATPPDTYFKDKISFLNGLLLEPVARINTELGKELTPLLDHLETSKANMISLEIETLTLIENYIQDPSQEDEGECNEEQCHRYMCEQLLNRLEEYITNSLTMSNGMARIWGDHVSRLLAGGDLIVAAMEARRKQFANTIRTIETDYNKLLDKLREASKEDELHETLESILAILEQSENSYKKKNLEEKKYLKKYDKICETGKNVTLAEIGLMRETVRKNQLLTVPNQSSENEIHEESDEVQQMNCKFVIIQKWMDGFFETVKTIIQELKKYIKGWYTDWYQTECKEVDETLKNNLEKLENQRNRIRRDVHDVRAAELAAHSERLASHGSGVKIVFAQMTGLGRQVGNEIGALSKDLNRWIFENVTSAEPANSLHAIARIREQLRSKVDVCYKMKIRVTKQAKLIVDRKILWMRRANAGFVKAIRLFSEGGNYSSAEAKSTIGKLKRIEKIIDRTGSKIKKKFAAYIAKSMKSIDLDSITKALASWDSVAKELLYKENQELMIEKTKRALKREVYNAKCCSRNVENLLTNPTGVLDDDYWVKISVDLEQCLAYFSIPPNSTKLECEGTTAIPGKTVIINKSNKIGKQPQKMAKKPLFQFTKLSKDNRIDNFLQNTKTILSSQFDKIQFAANKYYLERQKREKETKPKGKTGKKSRKKEKSEKGKQPNKNEYQESMEEVMTKLKHYNYECEIAWLGMVYDLLCSIFKIRNFCNEYVSNKLNKFREDWNAELKKVKEEAIDKLEVASVEGRSGWKVIEEKLKSSHGYPENKPSLQQLHTEADKYCKQVAADHVLTVLEHRALLSQKLNELNSQFDDLIEAMTRIQLIIFSNENIANRLSPTLNFVVRFIATGDTREDFTDFSFTTITYQAEPYRLCQVIFKLLEEIIPEEMASYELVKEVSKTLISPAQDSNLNKYDLKDFASKYIKEIAKEKNLQLSSCEKLFTSYNEEVLHWCKQWTHDVNSICKLYVRKAI